MLRLLLALVALTCAACDPGCDTATDLASGEVHGTLDGVDWSASAATWRVAATGVSIVAPPAVGWRLTLVAQLTDDGKDAAQRVHGHLPFQIVLGNGSDGGWALLNGDNTDTYTTDDRSGGGWLRLARKRSGDLLGCTDFTASDGRRTKQATLAFRAAPSE